jgi:hypothetical protein
MAHRTFEFWVSADNLRKREILNILFGEMNLEAPNLLLDGKNLIFTMRKPFNLFLKEANHTEWLPEVDVVVTNSYQEVKNFNKIYDDIYQVAV